MKVSNVDQINFRFILCIYSTVMHARTMTTCRCTVIRLNLYYHNEPSHDARYELVCAKLLPPEGQHSSSITKYHQLAPSSVIELQVGTQIRFPDFNNS